MKKILFILFTFCALLMTAQNTDVDVSDGRTRKFLGNIYVGDTLWFADSSYQIAGVSDTSLFDVNGDGSKVTTKAGIDTIATSDGGVLELLNLGSTDLGKILFSSASTSASFRYSLSAGGRFYFDKALGFFFDDESVTSTSIYASAPSLTRANFRPAYNYDSGLGGALGKTTLVSNGVATLLVDGTGVGIGSSYSPTYLLDVNGTGRFVNNLIVDDTTKTTVLQINNLINANTDGFSTLQIGGGEGYSFNTDTSPTKGFVFGHSANDGAGFSLTAGYACDALGNSGLSIGYYIDNNGDYSGVIGRDFDLNANYNYGFGKDGVINNPYSMLINLSENPDTIATDSTFRVNAELIEFNGATIIKDSLTIDSATLRYNSEEGVLEMTSKKWSEVALQMGLEDWLLGYNNTGSTIPNGTPVYSGAPVAGSQYKPTINYSYSTFEPFAQRTVGITTMDIPNGELGLVAERGEVRGLNTTGLSTSGALWLSADSSFTSTKPGVDTTLIILGGVLRVDNDSGVIYVDVERFLRESDTKSFTFTSQGIGSGTYWAAGFYEAPAADANLTQASPTVTYAADANSGHASHPFVVCGGAGTVDAGVVGLEVTGTYVDDQGNEEFLRDTIISDITAVALNEYYEAVKFTGVDTFRLIVISGSPTTYSLDFNYGFAKYDDWFNQDFWITGIEVTGLASANDANFDIELLEHTNTGWTYSAAAFSPGNGAIATRSSDMTKDDLYNGKNFAWKRDNLNTFIEGTGAEGFVIRITTGGNNSVQTMNKHVRATFD